MVVIATVVVTVSAGVSVTVIATVSVLVVRPVLEFRDEQVGFDGCLPNRRARNDVRDYPFDDVTVGLERGA